MMDENVLYPENEPPFIKIKREGDWKEISTMDDYPSKPVINADRTRLAYISPFEFEMAGELWLYDATVDVNKKIFTQEQAGKENAVKQILWADNDRLLILTGHIYGTISSNRMLYLLNTENDQLQHIFQVEANQDIRDLQFIHASSIAFDIATYNEDSTDYIIENKTLDISDFIESD